MAPPCPTVPRAETNPGPDVAPTGRRPCFLITIDTEGDNQWSRAKHVTTVNSEFLPRFQTLCESYGLKPTYLTTFEMATCQTFQEFARDLLKRGAGEIGMHPHAWNSLPLVPLTSDDSIHHTYLTEYPESVMRDKVAFLTDLLEETFGIKMTSHRGGRWAFNSVYARLLVERGYLVDCSVTPLISWAAHPGDPSQRGGPDYSSFPLLPYFIDLGDISRPGKSCLLEVPVTVMELQPPLVRSLCRCFPPRSLPRRALNKFFPPLGPLTPTVGNLKRMLRVVKRSLAEKRPCVQLALHSSNLMPGGSPHFPRAEDVETLYDGLHSLFSFSAKSFRGSTLTDFRREFSEG